MQNRLCGQLRSYPLDLQRDKHIPVGEEVFGKVQVVEVFAAVSVPAVLTVVGRLLQ
jgi:hypothetical protein